ncbi:MAG TPA: hypothetical protein VFQ60_01470, partial [Patescibacteria group bacterium]|nr:hypothetical protein [Patescibacteria group bacterium]
AKRTLTATWVLPAGITQVNASVDNNPASIPANSLDHDHSMTVTDLEDGVWYVHVRLHNVNGWSQTAHFRVQVDATAPTGLQVKEVSSDGLDAKARFFIQAADQTSGIDHFEIVIDNGAPISWKDGDAHIFSTPNISSGKHTILVKAIDRAGNFASQSQEFETTAAAVPTYVVQLNLNWFVYFLLIILMFLVLLLTVLIFLHMRTRHHLQTLRAMMRVEVGEAKDAVRGAFQFVRYKNNSGGSHQTTAYRAEIERLRSELGHLRSELEAAHQLKSDRAKK